MGILFLLVPILTLIVALLPFVIFIWVIKRLGGVEKALNRIERRLEDARGEGAGVGGGVGEVSSTPESLTRFEESGVEGLVEIEPGPTPLPGVPPEVEDHLGAILAWVKDDWILKLGALLLFAGLGWFVAYAALNNWVNPLARVLGAIGLGAAFSVHGWRGLGSGGKGAATFLVLGTAIILAAAFSGRVKYDLGSPIIAMAVIFAAAAVPAFASIRHRIPSLGRVALGAAILAPILASPVSSDWVGIFATLATVVAGFAWVWRRNGDPALQWLAFGGVVLYSLALWGGKFGVGEGGVGIAVDAAIPFAYTICAIFLFSLTSAAREEAKRMGSLSSERGRRELVSLWMVGGLFFSWTWWGVSSDAQGVALGAGAAVFLASGLFSLCAGGYRALLAHWSVAFALTIFALNKVSDFPGLTWDFAAAGIVITGGTFLATRNPRATLLASAALLPAIAGAYLSLSSTEWQRGGWGADALAILSGSLAALAGALLLGRLTGSTDDGSGLNSKVAHGLALGGVVLILALAWQLSQALLPGGSGTVVSLVLYSVVGVGAYYAGAKSRHPCLSKYGAILVLLVVARLLVVEVWAMDTPYRIGAFVTIGTLLLVTAKFARRWDTQISKMRGE